jgi:two-component system phosphate regulon sensor histidine kinase PhoR
MNSITLLINGLALSISFTFLLIFLWTDARKELYQLLAVFLVMVGLWHSGALLSQFVALAGGRELAGLQMWFTGMLELGFTGASVAAYAVTAAVVRLGTRNFRILVFASLLVVILYRLLLIIGSAPASMGRSGVTSLTGDTALTGFFYLIFGGASIYMLWRYRRKIRSPAIGFGLLLFVLGQSIGFLNPVLEPMSGATVWTAAAVLLICMAVFKTEIVRPLAERNAQVEALRRVSLSIASAFERDTILDQIVTQTADLLRGDAAALFLTRQNSVFLATAYHLPLQFAGYEQPVPGGVANQVAITGQSVLIENYRREWRGVEDLPLARETFGSVVCSPLVFTGQSIGSLMVIAGRDGRVFDREDLYLLQLLATQASLAIGHSRLFAEQSHLTRQVELAHSQLETVLSSTESPVIAVDRKLKVIFANPAARSLLAERVSLEPGASLLDLPAEILPGSAHEVMRGISKYKAFIYEFSINGRVFLAHVAALGSGRIGGFVVVCNDVTTLKELDRMKSEMVRMTSHDLKNPLQAAMANLDLLKDDIDADSNPDVQRAVDEIGRQLQRMYRIIRGILDLERMRSGSMAPEWCSAADLAQQALDEIRHSALEKQVALVDNASASVMLYCDPEQLIRALVNLLENAVKFTPRGGTVTLTVLEGQAEVIFSVRDTGIGIQAEAQERVFDRFFRAKQHGTDHVSGTGLGLSLVKTIVENHRGRVWLTSEVNVGSEFCIAIPIHAGQDAFMRQTSARSTSNFV